MTYLNAMIIMPRYSGLSLNIASNLKRTNISRESWKVLKLFAQIKKSADPLRKFKHQTSRQASTLPHSYV